MTVYSAPLDDMRFVLNELLEVEKLAELPGFEDATPDLVEAILGEAGKLCEEVLLPLNRSGDEAGCVRRQDCCTDLRRHSQSEPDFPP